MWTKIAMLALHLCLETLIIDNPNTHPDQLKIKAKRAHLHKGQRCITEPGFSLADRLGDVSYSIFVEVFKKIISKFC
jgi:hypothetical protein